MTGDDDGGDDERVKEVFAVFKRGVADFVGEDEAQTHFDLAVAYAEMGLVDDAVAELVLVLRIDPRHVQARIELARLRVDLDEPSPKRTLN